MRMLMQNVILISGARRLQCWLPKEDVPTSRNASLRLKGRGVDPEIWWKVEPGPVFTLESSLLRTDWAPYLT